MPQNKTPEPGPDDRRPDAGGDDEQADHIADEGRADDDSPVDRYRDSPGAALITGAEPVEPNEPG